MPRPSFNNVGLRRDRNLSDLENKDIALNNMLNNLVTTSDGSTFDKDDLQTAIKGLSNSTVTNTNIALMAGLTVKNTVLDPETSELVEEVAQPLITVKNQVDAILATTNDPPFFNGGDGLLAKFYEVEQIRPENELSINSNGAAVVFGNPVVTKKFWTNGLFEFSNKLDNALETGNGAIQWTGYYIPDSTGPSTFNFSSTGFIIVEFTNEFGNYEIKKNIYKTERTVLASTASAGDTIDTTAQYAATVAINDKLISVRDENGATIALPTDRDILVQGVGSTGITLSESISETGINPNWEFTFSAVDLIGTNSFSFSIVLADLEKYVPVQMRITLWFPGEEVEYFNKTLDANLSTQIKSSGDLPYWYLYTQVGDQQVEEGFKGFYDKRLLLGGGTIGPESVLVSSQYNKWLSLNPLVLNYDPPRSYADALRAVHRYSILQNSNVFSMSSTSPYTDFLEIGNVVIAPGIPEGSLITDISRNSTVIISELSTIDAVLDVVFMDHRGYLSNSFATSNGTTVTVTTTEGLKEGTVVIAENAPVGDYIRVTNIINNRQFETNIAINLTGSQRIYFYSDKGLQNRAYDNFCIGTIGAELSATAIDGSNYLTLNTVEGMTLNMVVQSAPYIPFDPGTNVFTRIQEINPIGFPPNTIRLTNPIAHPDNKDMIAGTTLVACPSNTTQNKEACVIPLNTAPPFVGTIDGLRTTDGSGTPATKDLELANVNGTLRVKNLKIENVPSSTEIPPGTTSTYDRTIPIKCAGVNFKILGSST